MSEVITVPSMALRKVLADILVSRQKAEDAPASAEAHMAQAIVILATLTEWVPDDAELRDDIEICRFAVGFDFESRFWERQNVTT